MEEETFREFEQYGVPGTKWQGQPPYNLNRAEIQLFQELQAENLRLEQEHISQTWVQDELGKNGMSLL